MFDQTIYRKWKRAVNRRSAELSGRSAGDRYYEVVRCNLWTAIDKRGMAPERVETITLAELDAVLAAHGPIELDHPLIHSGV